MPLFFVTGWMLYLKRRQQKKLTLAARQSQTSQQVDPNAKPWLITYASQTGVAEQLVWRTATSLQEAQQADCSETHSATQPTGFTAGATGFICGQYLWHRRGTRLGSRFRKSSCNRRLISVTCNMRYWRSVPEYPDSYCSFGYAVDKWLKQCHAARHFFELIEVDNANANDIQRWNQALSW